MKWCKTSYQKVIKSGTWDLEPHFFYYSQIRGLDLFRTFYENKMSIEDIRSALYGEFDLEGKPILGGFYEFYNLAIDLMGRIVEKNKLAKQENIELK